MSRWSFVRWLPAVFAPCALFVLSSTAAQTQRTAHSADERLRALSTGEWYWRRTELGQDADQQADAAHLPRVDAASQQARLAYWTRTLAALDGVPFDRLSAGEKVNAQIFRTSIRASSPAISRRCAPKRRPSSVTSSHPHTRSSSR
jgi:uncharacterized protein (DUF885 family)